MSTRNGCHNCGRKDSPVCSGCTALAKGTVQIGDPTMWIPDVQAVLKKKPPLGLTPEFIWKEKRLNDICHAIARYVFAGLAPLPEWADEGRRLMEELGMNEDG